MFFLNPLLFLFYFYKPTRPDTLIFFSITQPKKKKLNIKMRGKKSRTFFYLAPFLMTLYISETIFSSFLYPSNILFTHTPTDRQTHIRCIAERYKFFTDYLWDSLLSHSFYAAHSGAGKEMMVDGMGRVVGKL